jgi:hypothetical protein
MTRGVIAAIPTIHLPLAKTLDGKKQTPNAADNRCSHLICLYGSKRQLLLSFEVSHPTKWLPRADRIQCSHLACVARFFVLGRTRGAAAHVRTWMLSSLIPRFVPPSLLRPSVPAHLRRHTLYAREAFNGEIPDRVQSGPLCCSMLT